MIRIYPILSFKQIVILDITTQSGYSELALYPFRWALPLMFSAGDGVFSVTILCLCFSVYWW
jgi:hypothetical protein